MGGWLVVAAGIGVAALVLLPEAPIPVAAVRWAIAGLGMGLAYSALSLLVLETAAPGQEGASSAALQLMFTLGTALGAGSGGAPVALSELSEMPLAARIALADGLMLLAALTMAVLIGRIPERSERPVGTPPLLPHEPPVAVPLPAGGAGEEPSSGRGNQRCAPDSGWDQVWLAAT